MHGIHVPHFINIGLAVSEHWGIENVDAHMTDGRTDRHFSQFSKVVTRSG